MSSRVIHKMGLKEGPAEFPAHAHRRRQCFGPDRVRHCGRPDHEPCLHHWIRRNDHAAAADPHRRCGTVDPGPSCHMAGIPAPDGRPGWGSIFIVILVIMLCVYLLNRIFRSKDPNIKTARALPKAAPAFLCHQIISPYSASKPIALGGRASFSSPGAAAFLLLRGDPAPAGSALAARSAEAARSFSSRRCFIPLLLRIRQHSHPVAEAAVERILAHSDLARPVRYLQAGALPLPQQKKDLIGAQERKRPQMR